MLGAHSVIPISCLLWSFTVTAKQKKTKQNLKFLVWTRSTSSYHRVWGTASGRWEEQGTGLPCSLLSKCRARWLVGGSEVDLFVLLVFSRIMGKVIPKVITEAVHGCGSERSKEDISS